MEKTLIMQLIRLLFVLTAVITACFLFIYSFQYIFPLLLAIIISLIIHPFVNFLEIKARFPRFFAIITVMLSLFLICFGIILLIISEIYQGSAFLAEQIPKHYHAFLIYMESFFQNNVLPFYEKVLSFFNSLNAEHQETIHTYIRSLTNFLATSGSELLHNSLAKVPSILAVVPGSITTIVFVLLAIFMITNDLDNLKRKAVQFLPTETGKKMQQISSHFKQAITGFFRAQFILIFISACIILFGLLLLQVEHALTITVIAAFVDLIPYVGTGILFVPWIIYLYVVGDFSMTIGIAIIYMIVIISRQILEPKILSSEIGIHPLLLLIGMFIGLQAWGVIGILIAPLFLVMGNALYKSGIFQLIWQFIRG